MAKVLVSGVAPWNCAFAADVKIEDEKALPDKVDFLTLADLRGSLNSEIPALQKEIADIQARTTEIDTKKTQLDIQKKRYLEVQKKLGDKPAPGATQYLEFLQSQVASIESEVRGLEKDLASIPEKQSQLDKKRALARAVQGKIADLLSPEQQFKRTMSMTFAALIACVIVGFFIVAGVDDKIRQAIFSGQAGIQFLTLFSLVIAIILFGITGILEGKELAALLGGLSGYILGRVTP